MELSKAGDVAACTLDALLLTGPQQLGLHFPGQIAEIQDNNETWRGLVIAAQVQATRQSVVPTVEIERRFPDA